MHAGLLVDGCSLKHHTHVSLDMVHVGEKTNCLKGLRNSPQSKRSRMRMIGSVTMLCWHVVQNSVTRAEDCRLRLVNDSTYSCQPNAKDISRRRNKPKVEIGQFDYPERRGMGSSDDDGKHQLRRQIDEDCATGTSKPSTNNTLWAEWATNHISMRTFEIDLLPRELGDGRLIRVARLVARVCIHQPSARGQQPTSRHIGS